MTNVLQTQILLEQHDDDDTNGDAIDHADKNCDYDEDLGVQVCHFMPGQNTHHPTCWNFACRSALFDSPDNDDDNDR